MIMKGVSVRPTSMLLFMVVIAPLINGRDAFLFHPSSFSSSTTCMGMSVSTGRYAFTGSLGSLSRTRRTIISNIFLPNDCTVTKKRVKMELSMMLLGRKNDNKDDDRNKINTFHFVHSGTHSSNAVQRSRMILYSKGIEENDNINDNDNGNVSNSSSINERAVKQEQQETNKPMSRLAMAAADWLDDDDDGYDELSNYWNKFEEAKNNKSEKASLPKEVKSSSSSLSPPYGNINPTTTTEELLDRYYKGRGIDKSMESKYKDKIKDAIQKANNAPNASEAIKILQSVRPYMQPNTKFGGEALIELAQAYDANNEEDSACEIYTILLRSPHLDIRLQVKQMIENPKQFRKEYGKANKNRMWFSSFDSWWS